MGFQSVKSSLLCISPVRTCYFSKNQAAVQIERILRLTDVGLDCTPNKKVRFEEAGRKNIAKLSRERDHVIGK